MLAQTYHEIRGYQRTAHANALQGVSTEFIGPQKVKELCPIIKLEGPRYPVLGALWQPRGDEPPDDRRALAPARVVPPDERRRALLLYVLYGAGLARLPGHEAHRAVGEDTGARRPGQVARCR